MNKLDAYDSFKFMRYTYKSELDKAVHTLEGIVKGIAIDGIINSQEVNELRAWWKNNKIFVYRRPFIELFTVVENALSDNILDEEELKDIIWFCNNFKNDNIYFDVITSDIQRLQGILHGIMSDNLITQDEIIGLQQWIEENDHLVGNYPYDEINSVITAVLSDGIITEEENNLLKAVFGDFIYPASKSKINHKELSKIKQEMKISGVCAMCPEIRIENKIFCFTGVSSKTSRSKILNVVSSLKGTFTNSISKNTDYLIVGNNGNPCWAFSCYGRKIEAAVRLRKSGHKVMIVHENDFWDAINDLVSMST